MGHRETLTPNLVTIAFIIAKRTAFKQTDKAFNADQDDNSFATQSQIEHTVFNCFMVTINVISLQGSRRKEHFNNMRKFVFVWVWCGKYDPRSRIEYLFP